MKVRSVEASPRAIVETIVGYRKAKVLLTAASLNLFSRLERPRGASSLALDMRLDARACEILLDALVALGYLRKAAGKYRNAPIASRFLVPGRPGYMGHNLRYQDLVWPAWGDLENCVRRGGAARPLEHWLSKRPGFARGYIGGMSGIAAKPAAEIAALVPTRGAQRLLDVGAGAGTYSAAFMARNPDLRAVLFDLRATLKVSRAFLREDPALHGRVQVKAGDYRYDSFGHEEFDLVLLSHVTHDESPEMNRELLAKAHAALRPGGRVVIHDFVVNAARTAPEFGALFAVHMLTYTEAGRTYTSGEYRQWLREAGFRRAAEHPICAEASNASRIFVANK